MKKRTQVAGKPRSRRLTHLDERGQARMVDVAEKPETDRVAVASSAVKMNAATLRALTGAGTTKTAKTSKTREPATTLRTAKGDVFAVARLAALAALKRTPDWIPLAHPVRVVGTRVDLQIDPRLPGVRVAVEVRAIDRTGVEMEAMVGASAAALAVYDMVKAVQRDVEVVSVRLEEKRGGRSGHWRRTRTS